MSKRKYWGRFTALGIAGITAVSSMAVAAEAVETTKIYEFTYTGIASIPHTASANWTVNGNYFIGELPSDPTAPFVVDGNMTLEVEDIDGFTYKTVTVDIADFELSNADVYNYDGDKWAYCNDGKALFGEVAHVAEVYADRNGGDSTTLYFKSKADRDSALKKVQADVKSAYSTMFSKASSSLKSDLTKASNAVYDRAVALATRTRDRALEEAKDPDTGKIDSEDRKEIEKEYSEAKKEATLLKQARSKAITQITKEFKEVYDPKNYHWETTGAPDSEYAYWVDDSKPEVQMTIIGGFVVTDSEYESSTGGDGLNLENAYYRTTTQYDTASRYAFTGEVVNREDAQKREFCVGSWIKFSDYVQGSDNSHGSSSSSGGSSSGSSSSGGTSSSTNVPTYVANVFYNSATRRYYPTSAVAQSANASGVITPGYTDTKGNYFNTVTGKYYSTLGEAVSATGNSSDVLSATGATVAVNNSSAYSSLDPYYYYYLQRAANGNTNNSASVAAAPAGSPAIYGTSAANYAGWDNIVSYIKRSKSGSGVKIAMHDSTVVPASVLSTAKSNGITLQFVNKNGASWTISPANVISAQTFDTTIKYNTKNIKSTLVNAAKKKNPGTVSTAQVTIGDGASLGVVANVTVKLPAKRSGCTVKAYRLNGSKLTLESTSKVQSTGAVTLTVEKGGSYLLVVVD